MIDTPRERARVCSIQDILRGAHPVYEMIHLEGVRLLSKGKTADAPASKGKAKGKGKGKSKGKGK